MARARRPGLKLVAPTVPETALHSQIAQIFRIELCREGHISPRGACWWSVDISNYGGKIPGTRVARGIVAGIPDMVVLFRGCAYFIEVKRDTGELSDPQRELAFGILYSGSHFGLARNAEEAVALLDIWQIPRAGRFIISKALLSAGAEARWEEG